MPATSPARAPEARATMLPAVTVARFAEATRLIERLVDEQADLFIGHGNAYRTRHREGTSRPLHAAEAAQIAAAMLDDDTPLEQRAANVQQSGLRAYDDATPQEVLLAAGLKTAPAFLHAALRIVALLEMPADQFELEREAGRLDEALDDTVGALEHTGIEEMRERASSALSHLAAQAGAPPGEALALLGRAAWQAIQQGMSQLAISAPTSSSLTGSPPPTDGRGETSSTTPPTATP